MRFKRFASLANGLQGMPVVHSYRSAGTNQSAIHYDPKPQFLTFVMHEVFGIPYGRLDASGVVPRNGSHQHAIPRRKRLSKTIAETILR
jgi:hypothetical protein